MLKRLLLLPLAVFIIQSCTQTEDQETRRAVDEARFHLSSMNCSKAKKVLDDVGFKNDNADYISVYAATQACYADFKILDFFRDNIDNINSASLISSLASFTTSNETEADSTNYTALQDAITTLVESSGGAQPSTVDRNAKFGELKSGDLSLQALYLIFVQLGKHFALYGNANNAGTKGGGTAGNSCLYSYVTNDAVDWVTTQTTGSCSAATGSEGSDLLEAPETAADIKRRLCYGIVLYNNMIDILSNVTLPGSSEIGDVGNIQSTLNTLMAAAESAETGIYNDGPATGTNAIATMRVITGQDECEAEELDRIEKFYAIFFETIYQ